MTTLSFNNQGVRHLLKRRYHGRRQNVLFTRCFTGETLIGKDR
jgi:hypothetical protein